MEGNTRWIFEKLILPLAIGVVSAWGTIQVTLHRLDELESAQRDHEMRLRSVETFAAQNAQELKREIIEAIRAVRESDRRGG